MVKWTVLTALLLIFIVASGIASASPIRSAGQSLAVERSADRTSATATWTPGQGAETQAFAVAGKLLVGEQDTTGYGVAPNTLRYVDYPLPGDVSSLVIDELDPAREYIYAVTSASRDSDGNWVWTPWDSVGLLPPQTSAATDRQALIALYMATDGANWRENTNWLSDAPLANWHGVKTNADGRVVELNLWLNKLNGELPSELGNLAKLRRLNLMINRLGGELPSELGNLTALQYLALTANEFTGEIPIQLGGLFNLDKLYLSVGNQFTGCIPSALRYAPDNDLSDLGLPFCS